MKSIVRKAMILATLALMLAGMTACNTTQGFGEDLEATGQEIQKGTR